MKNRVMIALFVTVVLALPAFAQTSSTSQDQPAASQPAQTAPASSSSTSTPDSSQTVGATGKQPLQAETHEGFWGKMNPFARKKYVQRQTQPIRDRVNELDELTASNSKMIKDVDSRAQQGIQLASAKANEADQHGHVRTVIRSSFMIYFPPSLRRPEPPKGARNRVRAVFCSQFLRRR